MKTVEQLFCHFMVVMTCSITSMELLSGATNEELLSSQYEYLLSDITDVIISVLQTPFDPVVC